MIIKFGMAENLYKAIMKLNTIKTPMSLNIKLKLLRSRMSSDIEIFESQKTELINKYGEDGSISPLNENWEEFLKEFVPLLNEEVDFNISSIGKTYEDFLEELLLIDDIDNIELTNDELNSLILICEEEK